MRTRHVPAEGMHLTSCLTVAFTPQIDPTCSRALLDNDTDVDESDATLFVACYSGPGLSADPNCAP